MLTGRCFVRMVMHFDISVFVVGEDVRRAVDVFFNHGLCGWAGVWDSKPLISAGSIFSHHFSFSFSIAFAPYHPTGITIFGVVTLTAAGEWLSL